MEAKILFPEIGLYSKAPPCINAPPRISKSKRKRLFHKSQRDLKKVEMLKEPSSLSSEQPIHGPRLDDAGRSPPACSDPHTLNSDGSAAMITESSSISSLQASPKAVDPQMKNRKRLSVASSLISSKGYDLRPRRK